MSCTVPPLPGPLHHPEAEAEAEGEAEAGDAAGCLPEGAGATTMEARPEVAAGAVVAVAGGVAVALPLDDERV